MFANLMDRTQGAGQRRAVSEQKRTTRPASELERPNERPDAQTIERPADSADGPAVGLAMRTKVRHSFDVYRDQLLALGDIQQSVARQQGKRPRLGDLVQEALDSYIQAKS